MSSQLSVGRNRRWPSPRIVVFVALCLLSMGIATVYTIASAARVRDEASAAKAGDAATQAALAAVSAAPHLVYLQSSGDTFRRVVVAPLEPSAPALNTDLWCQRVHFAGGMGLCLGKDAFKGGAFIFNAEFEVTHEFAIAGLASRARVSADGRYGSVTVFVQGHSYADAGFSTRTAIVDMHTGDFVLGDLEELDVRKDGDSFDAIDRNFWGVTFVPGGTTFYATMGTGGRTYLLFGDFLSRTATVLRENVECPSLSPDGSQLVFKKQVSAGITGTTWELRLLDLATMDETTLGDLRNIDDQVEWLDDHRILYYLQDEGPPATIRPDLWVAGVDGSPPQLLRTGAFSPAVVR